MLPALLLFALMVGELALMPREAGEAASTPLAYAWAALITLPIAAHRRWPVAVVLLVAAAVVGYAFGHHVAFPGFAAFALVFVTALHCGRGAGALAFAAMSAAVGVAIAVQPAGMVTASTWVTSMLALAVSWLAGENLRARQSRWEAMRDRAARLEAEQAQQARQAVIEERLRIARELHDVVAHSMSVIAVQAGVANHVIDTRPDLARQALGTVETSTRAALVEMRRLLGVLRHADEPSAGLAPSPGLAEVDRLVAQLAEVGLTVRVRTGGTAVDLSDGLDLSAYRIVQEALTNVLRHGGPVAEVRIDYTEAAVRISVSDDGRHGGSAARDRAPGQRPAGQGPAGHGLAGMRERVAVFGGTFAAGPRPGGGFDLRATLPYDHVPPPMRDGAAVGAGS
jgi:signal transduction histidine kinase